MNTACHTVPLALAGLALTAALSGCYAAHEIAGGDGRCRPPPSMVCCLGSRALPRVASGCPFRCARGELVPASSCVGASPDAGARPDAGSPSDGGVALRCEAQRARAACFAEGRTIAPLAPFELPVYFEGCVCCSDGECRVEVDEPAHTLRLTTALCPDSCVCDICSSPVVQCSLPGLPAGDWTVINNGAEAFDLAVRDILPRDPPLAACVTFAEPDPCALGERVAQVLGQPDELCVTPALGGAPPTLDLLFGCSGCGELAGNCEVSVEGRVTDDLPPGGEVYLGQVRTHMTQCDVDCPGVCVARTQSCQLPDLLPGGYYRVWHEGRIIADFVESRDAVCGGLFPPD